MNQHTDMPAYRGTIIVDACVLEGLCAEISPELTTKPLVNYLNTLQFLADHGYRVLIPEIVAIERARISRSGKPIDRAFDYHLKDQAVFGILAPVIKEALAEPRFKHHPGRMIEIVHNTGPAKVDHYCREIDEAVNADHPARVRSSVIQLDRTFSRENFGDDAIMEMLRDPQYREANDLIVLTDDKGLRDRMDALKPMVEHWTTRKLVFGFAAAGLGKHAGIAADGLTAVKDFSVNANRMQGRTEDIPPFSDLWQSRVRFNRFSASMQQLATELDGTSPPPQEPAQESGASRFAAKYGGGFGGKRPAQKS